MNAIPKCLRYPAFVEQLYVVSLTPRSQGWAWHNNSVLIGHHGLYSHVLLFVLQTQNARLIGPLDYNYLQSIMWLSIDIILTFNRNLEWAIDYRTSLQLQTPRWIQIRWIIWDRLVPDINVIFGGVAIPNNSINMGFTCKHSYNSCW